MTLDGSRRPNVEEVLRGLKDFQRHTVDYIFRRLYTDADSVSRFLIADEVGLGKTLVARGVIAKAVDHLWDTVGRIDVIYICSNLAIAQQNLDRLNITADRHFQFASRATLLPITLEELRGNKLNFVSLTPGTSFNLRSQSGWKYERAVLYFLLKQHWDVPEGTLSNVLRGDVRKDRWKWHLAWFAKEKESEIDEELRQAFYDALDEVPDIARQYDTLAEVIGPRRKHLTWEMRSERDHWIGDLRRLLARSCLSALEPDLVILDEFQRFKYLLDPEGDLSLLARELFTFPDVKVLLLSATPYKMYTLQEEQGEDHYKDFYHTVSFLLRDQPQPIDELVSAIGGYGRAVLHLDSAGRDELREAKDTIETVLRRVMVRTERLAASADRNGMLSESVVAQDQVHPADLAGFIHLDRIARALDAGDQVEYWKSSPYPLNLMEEYRLKKSLEAALSAPGALELRRLLESGEDSFLSWATVDAYQVLDPGNARLRSLSRDSLETGNWQLLWMPPSLPYYQPDGPFRGIEAAGCTKTLVFSAWRLVPKTIAMLLSYEAERRMLGDEDRDFSYTELTEKRRPLLTFARSRDRLTGMPVFCLTYPCLTLARKVDPLGIAKGLMNTAAPSSNAVFDACRGRIEELLNQATASMNVVESGPEDEVWYWASLAILDSHFSKETVGEWLSDQEGEHAWSRLVDADSEHRDDEGGETRFAEHVETFTRFFRSPSALGKPPSDLLDILTYVALSSPAVASLRALLRIVSPEWTAFLSSSAKVGLGFRTLFNQPEVISLLRSLYPEGAHWQKALRYCLDGNLQSVLDEYYHVLHESLGLVGHDAAETADKLCATVQHALSLRAPTLRFDEIILPDEGTPTLEKRGLRCRYALRFGTEKGLDYEERTRDIDVRIAFNSPFRPFILATTSIGQEGLDFHQYCHRVVHWNLPSNPVDLEQREGRIHRYKGHVIRRNLALGYGLSAVETGGPHVDPWRQLFDRAVGDRPSDANDLVPFWIYRSTDPTQETLTIERRIPVFPLSREIGRMEQLKRSLVAYRSVIGQPRQQELLEFLAARLSEEEIQEFVESAMIDLSPPGRQGKLVG
ncbi:MAG TPA: helicase-related protein [Anaerolineae bacterium]|nr:helicase-related protein [Anaerolineae bacterium]